MFLQSLHYTALQTISCFNSCVYTERIFNIHYVHAYLSFCSCRRAQTRVSNFDSSCTARVCRSVKHVLFAVASVIRTGMHARSMNMVCFTVYKLNDERRCSSYKYCHHHCRCRHYHVLRACLMNLATLLQIVRSIHLPIRPLRVQFEYYPFVILINFFDNFFCQLKKYFYILIYYRLVQCLDTFTVV